MIGMISSSAWHKIIFTAGLSVLGSFVSLPEFLKETSPTVLLDFHKTWQMFNMTSNSVDLNFYGLSAFGMCPSVLLCFRHPMERCFYFRFILNGKSWFVIDSIIRKHLLFLFLCFVSNIYCKISFMVKNGSDLKQTGFLEIFCQEIFFAFFFTDFKLLMFRNYTVKISEILNKWNSLKTCIDFCLFCSHFLLSETRKKTLDFYKTYDWNKTFCA